MKALRMAVMVFMLLFVSVSLSVAGDFAWMNDFNAQASLDPSGFRARLAARFNTGDAQISAVMSNIHDPAGVYMAFRLGEMSHQPVERVVDSYKKNRGKGWGVIAKSLGIKPGSPEFHALKRGDDLYTHKEKGKGKGGKGKGKGKEKG